MMLIMVRCLVRALVVVLDLEVTLDLEAPLVTGICTCKYDISNISSIYCIAYYKKNLCRHVNRYLILNLFSGHAPGTTIFLHLFTRSILALYYFERKIIEKRHGLQLLL